MQRDAQSEVDCTPDGTLGNTAYFNRIGGIYTTSYNWEGYLDEIWVFSDAKSENFQKAVYNNVQNYSTFITIDGAVTIGSSPKQVYPVWADSSQQLSENVSCGIGIASTISHSATFNKSISAGLGIAATLWIQRQFTKSMSCGIGIAAAVTAVRNVPSAIDSGIGITATIDHQAEYIRGIPCGLGISAAITKSGGLESVVVAGIGVSTTITIQANYTRAVAAGIGIDVSIAKIQERYGAIESGIGITAAIGTIAEYPRPTSCGLGIAAAITSQADFIRGVSCGIGIDSVVDIPAFESISCSIGISASISRGQGTSRIIGVGIGLNATITRSITLIRAIPSGLGISAAISTSATLTKSVSFGIGITASPITQVDFSKGILCGIGLSAMVTHKVYTDLEDYNIEKITVSKNIQDAMWQATININGTTIPAYFRHYIIEMTDYNSVSHTVFHGFFPNADYNLAVANNKVNLTAYDYGWYLAAQYVPNEYKITDINTNPSAIILALLGGESWRNTTGIEPYNIQDVAAWGTTLTKKSFVFDKKTSKKQAIDEICAYTNHLFVLKWREDESGQMIPCAYFIHEDDIDTELDLPSKVTFTHPSVYLKEGIKIEDKQNEKVNRVRVAGANAVTGEWFEAVVESAGVTYGDEIAIEYYSESSNLDTQEKVDDKAQALFDFFNTVAKTYTATLVNRPDLELYQLVKFSGYSLIGTEDMRIIGISYTEYGTHNETTIQFTSDQSLSDLKALNRSMGGDIYNNTTNILNHYFIDLTKIAVGTITAIDGNSATIKLEDGSGFVTARLINQDE